VPREGASDYPLGGSSLAPFGERQEVGDPDVHVIGDPEGRKCRHRVDFQDNGFVHQDAGPEAKPAEVCRCIASECRLRAVQECPHAPGPAPAQSGGIKRLQEPRATMPMPLDRQSNDTFGRFLIVWHGNAPWPPVALRLPP
jgi:hypothetical protein